MPTYEFKCSECGHIFEEIQCKIGEQNRPCPCCNGEGKKLFSSPNFKVRGGTGKFHQNSDNNLDPSLGGVPLGEVPGDDDYYDLNSPFSPKP